MKKKKILLIDDDHTFCDFTKQTLEEKNYIVEQSYNKHSAIKFIQNTNPDLVLLDLRLPNPIDGMDVLKFSLQTKPELPVIMISNDNDIQRIVNAIKQGAYDFVVKPIEQIKTWDTRLPLTIENALKKKELKIQNLELKKQSIGIIGNSSKMQKIRELIIKYADSNEPVLIMGETGTGKELVANALHNLSNRGKRDWIPVNCAAIPKDLIESELFGHVRGAFTDAIKDKIGKFERANHSTIFLDEIGDMSLNAQAKILRVLQEEKLQRVGSSKTIKVDVRIIAASNKDLKEEMEKGNFREDLYYRLNVLNIFLPPLRERKEDIPLLSKYFLQKFCLEQHREVLELSPAASELLIENNWKGNIRELEKSIRRAIVMCDSSNIKPDDLKSTFDPEFDFESISNPKTLKEELKRCEKEFILKILAKHKWKVSETTQELGIDRTNLYKKMKVHNISTERK